MNRKELSTAFFKVGFELNGMQLIGWTPLVELKNIAGKEGAVARIVGKLECQQPLGSVKDRIALP